jgi:exodeoxyribonuclease VIII
VHIGLARFGVSLGKGHIRRERVAVWQEAGVLCRARIDAFDERTGTIYDVKTTRLATDVALERSVRDYGYHVQAAAYTSAVEHLEPVLAGRVRFVLLFVETDTWEVVPVDLAGDLRELGARRWRRAVDAWGRCLKAAEWPGYATKEIKTLNVSQWAMTQDEFDAGELRDRLEGL